MSPLERKRIVIAPSGRSDHNKDTVHIMTPVKRSPMRPDEKSAAEVLVILREDSHLPPTLPSLPTLFAEAREAKLGTTILAGPLAPESVRQRAKRRHDLKASIRTIQLLVKALREGYRFDDSLADEKIAAIGRAALVLEKEGQLLDRILAMD